MAIYMSNPFNGAPTQWPFPQETWLFNRFALDAMRLCTQYSKMLDKDANLWTPEEDKLYVDIQKDASNVTR
jgi:hypothetical protein